MHITLFLVIIYATIVSKAFALTHPSCIKDVEQQASKTTEVAIPKEKPKIDFSNKKILKQQTKEHRQYVYKVLIENKISPRIAKYAKKLNFIERPTVESKNQPEFTFTLESYTSRFIKRTPSAKKFLENNLEAFIEAEKQYGVDKEAIAALMLIESNLGGNKGKLKILDALFTMSHPYNSSRNTFFTNELVATFKLLSSNNYYLRSNTMGSWAGAMGYVQFIPSSVLAYARDGNGDGKIDIINNKIDAIYSAANYLKNAKWQKGQTIVQEIHKSELSNINLCKDLNKPYQDGTLVLAEIKPEERYFITYGNYNSLLRWNKSFVFAYTVQLIIDELKKA
jgi:membrane-bound lytic murein transglycosylase B